MMLFIYILILAIYSADLCLGFENNGSCAYLWRLLSWRTKHVRIINFCLTELFFSNNPEANGKSLLDFWWGNQGDAYFCAGLQKCHHLNTLCWFLVHKQYWWFLGDSFHWKFPWILKVLHGTIDAEKEPFMFKRVDSWWLKIKVLFFWHQ